MDTTNGQVVYYPQIISLEKANFRLPSVWHRRTIHHGRRLVSRRNGSSNELEPEYGRWHKGKTHCSRMKEMHYCITELCIQQRGNC